MCVFLCVDAGMDERVYEDNFVYLHFFVHLCMYMCVYVYVYCTYL